MQNNESEEQAAQNISQIYDRVQHQVYLFLTATLIAIALTSLYLIVSNRQLFARLAMLSEQRSDLAQKLISTQESTLRYISRELHDEFGQILERRFHAAQSGQASSPRIPHHSRFAGSSRGNSEHAGQSAPAFQALHPVMLDELGLESTLDWYLLTVERQAGIRISSRNPVRRNSPWTAARRCTFIGWYRKL